MARELTVAEALGARRTVRRFDPDRPLGSELLVRILDLATLAPSRDNLQPWRFLVVRDRKTRGRLQRCGHGLAGIAEASVAVIVLGQLDPHRTHLGLVVDEMVRRGLLDPAGAAAIRGRAASAMERRTDPTAWAARTAMLAAMALLLAAESLGVGSALIDTGFEPEELRRAFGIPDDHAIGCVIGLGHAREPQPFPGRLPFDAVCFGEHFGRPFDPAETGKAATPREREPRR